MPLPIVHRYRTSGQTTPSVSYWPADGSSGLMIVSGAWPGMGRYRRVRLAATFDPVRVRVRYPHGRLVPAADLAELRCAFPYERVVGGPHP